jgi:hypothetical protein
MIQTSGYFRDPQAVELCYEPSLLRLAWPFAKGDWRDYLAIIKTWARSGLRVETTFRRVGAGHHLYQSDMYVSGDLAEAIRLCKGIPNDTMHEHQDLCAAFDLNSEG